MTPKSATGDSPSAPALAGGGGGADRIGAGEYLAVFLLGSCALLNIYSTQPLLPGLAVDFDAGVTAATWTVSAATAGVAVMAPLAGSVSDRWGRKSVMLAAVALLAVLTAVCALAPSLPVLIGLRVAQGLAIPFIFAVAVAYIAERYEGRGSEWVNSLYVSGTAFGGFAGRFISGGLTTLGGWRLSFVGLALFCVITLVVVAVALPREEQFVPAPSLGRGLAGLGAHARNLRLWGTCGVGAAILFLQVASFTYAGLYLARPPFGLSELDIGTVFAVFLVAVAITPLAGRLIGSLGRLRTFLIAAVAALVGLGLMLVPAVWAIVAGLALSASAVFCGQSCSTGAAAALGGRARSAAVGLYLTAYYLGGSLGGVVPAPLFAAAGWQACVALLVGVVLLGTLLATASWRPPAPSGPTATAARPEEARR